MDVDAASPARDDGDPVLVVGLGRMGSAIARTLAASGRPVRAWNRTPADPGLWSGTGVAIVDDLRAAVRACAVVVAVPFSYANTREVLGAAAEADLLGKVVVNLSWGSLADADEMHRWSAAAGAAYLDGALLCYPEELGGPGGRIVLSGDAAAADRALEALAPLGPVRYLGEQPAAANAVGTAAGVVFYHAALAAFFEAIAFASRFGVEPRAMLPEVRAMLDLLSKHVEKDVATIEAGSYDDATATVDVHLDGARMAMDDLAAVGQPSPLMAAFVELVAPLAEAGHGDESIARLYGLLRHATAPGTPEGPTP